MEPGFSVATRDGAIEATALVFAGPAAESATLLRPTDGALAGLLDSIETAPVVVVCLGFDAAALEADRGPLDGFGFLVPRSEGIRTLGALWESTIYPNRAPVGKSLLRVILGGAHDPGAIRLDDEELTRIVLDELRTTMGLHVRPEFIRIVRHAVGIPQYTVGHLARLQRIESRLERHPGLFLAGNSYRGVAINSCIAEAPAIARRVVDFIGNRQRQIVEPAAVGTTDVSALM
jgi:oxygen-dependent protoporphyrinogen oxidase